jgi:hypothetical protein
MAYLQIDRLLAPTSCADIVDHVRDALEDVEVEDNGDGVYSRMRVKNHALSALVTPLLDQNPSIRAFLNLPAPVHVRCSPQWFYTRYVEGGYIKPHMDGTESIGEAKSVATILIYLTPPLAGGETLILSSLEPDAAVLHTVVPRAGSALLLSPETVHCGMPSSGEKMLVRSDLFLM